MSSCRYPAFNLLRLDPHQWINYDAVIKPTKKCLMEQGRFGGNCFSGLSGGGLHNDGMGAAFISFSLCKVFLPIVLGLFLPLLAGSRRDARMEPAVGDRGLDRAGVFPR